MIDLDQQLVVIVGHRSLNGSTSVGGVGERNVLIQDILRDRVKLRWRNDIPG